MIKYNCAYCDKTIDTKSTIVQPQHLDSQGKYSNLVDCQEHPLVKYTKFPSMILQISPDTVYWDNQTQTVFCSAECSISFYQSHREL
jgi:hypothetical protein